MNEEAPRLVVEASLDWEKGTEGNVQRILLSLSTPYFGEQMFSPVGGAVVTVTNTSTGAQFAFADAGEGSYVTDVFVPVLNQEYRLEIVYEGKTYTAVETLMPVSSINTVTQSTEDGFDNEAIEINTYFTDPEEEENYYLMRYHLEGEPFPSLEDISDEFTNGNEIREIYEQMEDEDNGMEELHTGDVLRISLHGISETYYNYIRLLIEQSGGGGDPFSAIPARLRGNVTGGNPEEYAFGYFRLTEVDRRVYVVE